MIPWYYLPNFQMGEGRFRPGALLKAGRSTAAFAIDFDSPRSFQQLFPFKLKG
jgi:hypothetical protein